MGNNGPLGPYSLVSSMIDFIFRNLFQLFNFAGLCNPQCPRTFGDGQVHQSHLDAFVYIDHPLPVSKKKIPSKEDTTIGKIIAENLVDNGATLQMGVFEFL